MEVVNKKVSMQGSGALMPPSGYRNPDTHICKHDKCVRAKKVLAVLVTAIEKSIISPEYFDLMNLYKKENGPYNGPNFLKELGLAKQSLATFYAEEYVMAPDAVAEEVEQKPVEATDEKDTIT